MPEDQQDQDTGAEAMARGWTRSPLTGILSCSVGPWGERQRLFQKRVGGPFYCSAYLTDGRRQVRSLGTADPIEALRVISRRLVHSMDRACSTIMTIMIVATCVLA
jgi:hypothetical protein